MAIENLKRVIENEETPVDAVTALDVTTVDAYQADAAATARVEEVKDELEKRADDATLEGETVETKVPQNDYTKEVKLTLDESFNDFSITEADEVLAPVEDGRSHKTMEDDDEDDYLDYDMFDFIYGLVTDTWPKPKNPLPKKRIRKFLYTGSDDYLDSNTPDGHSQVASDGNGKITVYANEMRDFDDIKAICDIYQFEYTGPIERRSSTSHWKYSFEIAVPMTADEYPMMVDDYFATIGLTLDDVMPADFVIQYNKRSGKIEKEQSTALNDFNVQKIYDEFVRKAANSNDPLDGFIRDMFAEMSLKNLKFNQAKLRKAFKAEFEDDFED